MYDPAASLWRTHQLSLLWDWEPFSETWPRWGSMRNGVCWERTTQAPLTYESESGYWQTPVADDCVNRKEGKFNSRGEAKLSAQVLWPTPIAGDAKQAANATVKNRREGSNHHSGTTLTDAIRMWPTPLATDGSNGGPNQRFGNGDLKLSSAVHCWPTPTARDYRSPGLESKREERMAQRAQPLTEVIGGQLNPNWVEWLMGWPVGWTASAPLATDRFQQWSDSHGIP